MTIPFPHPKLRPPPVAGCCELSGAAAAVAGFVVAQSSGPVLWVQDRLSVREAGRPCFLGLRLPVLVMRLSHPRDVLAAAEEGLACRDLGAVVAEIHGNPAALDFTASRRLAIRAEASGVRLWLIRHGAQPDNSAMRDRWRLTGLPSAAHPDDPAAPGDPRWRAELLRSREARPGEWVVRHDRTTDLLRFDPGFSDGALAEDAGANGRRGAG